MALDKDRGTFFESENPPINKRRWPHFMDFELVDHFDLKNFKIKRSNDLSINSWRKLFNSVKSDCSKIHKDLPKLIETNLADVEKKITSKTLVV